MANQNKKIFFSGLGLSFVFGLLFMFAFIVPVSADTININANVPSVVVPVCGNGILESGEECENDSHCSSGTCDTSTCTCKPPGNFCIPHAVVCNWGLCVDGIQTGQCSDGCVAFTQTRSCTLSTCGNSILEAGEECDPPGQCCSTECKILIVIANVTENASQNSAILSWQTPCQTANSTLEYGTTVDLIDGQVIGLTGQDFTYTLTGLIADVTYFYRITVTAGSLQTSYFGSFKTLFQTEICDDGIDNDGDGLIDIADPDCPCEPEYSCTDWTPPESEPCPPSGFRTRTCEKTNQCWKNLPPATQQGCALCQLTCGVCEDLNIDECRCEVRPFCCGNGICEPPNEDPYNCFADCPVDCLSNWQCTEWVPPESEPCPPSGFRARECFDLNACPQPIGMPPITTSCSENCPGLSCNVCQQINVDQCICEEMVPCCGNGRCEDGENNVNCAADCIEVCDPSWSCSAWSACQNSVQTRTCSESKGCNFNRPPEIRACDVECDVACGLCETIDVAGCRCIPQSPCCGNRICEFNESLISCPFDCGLPPTLRLGLTQCLDGLDNDKDGDVDYPADKGCSGPGDNSELNIAEIIENVVDTLKTTVWENEVVQAVNKVVAVPTIVSAVAISTFSSFSFFNLFSYARYFFSQPLAALFRRKRKKWGVVYNALSKQPIDLAIVRLYRKEDGKLVQSRVTDKMGRYLFLADPGRYYISVTKPKFNFPTRFLADKKEDPKFLDLYHGETIEVKDEKVNVTLNVPLDPIEDQKTPRKVVIEYYLRRLQYAVAFSAIPLATISLAISPSLLTLAILLFHTLLFILFRRLGYQKPPKNWGIIYDEENKKPIGRAITRIYDKEYNKLLETRITDSKGRYTFLVDKNIYYLTTEKPGYESYKSSDIDLVQKDRDAIIGMDIPLNKADEAGGVPAEPKQPSTAQGLPPQEDKAVSYEYLKKISENHEAEINGKKDEIKYKPAEEIKAEPEPKVDVERELGKLDEGEGAKESGEEKSIFG